MLNTNQHSLNALTERPHEVARILSLIANPKRLLVLCFLVDGEASVGKIQDALGIGQSSLSQHLTKLREGGVVATRRDAQTIYYRLGDERILTIMQAMCETFAKKG